MYSYSQLTPIGLTAPYNIHIYPGAGCAENGKSGDHMMIAPAYNIDEAEVNFIVEKVSQLIEDFFDDYDRSHSTTS
jgi:hypothetical protein